MSDETELFTIGELARRTGLPVRTIRFWSDCGVLAPAGRSAGGYRLYDQAAAVRLDLVRTLRELGLDLDTVRRVLRGQTTVRDVAGTHLRAVEAEIRTLQVRRAVLRRVARQGSTTKEMRLLHELARMTAEERQRILDDYVRETFESTGADGPGAHIAQAMRTLPANLPDDPTPEQEDAWVELVGLLGDEEFRRRTREMAVAGARSAGEPPALDPQRVGEHAAPAVRDGVSPESPEGAAILNRIVGREMPSADRLRLADTLDTFTDRRVERYWQLLGVLNGRPPVPPQVPAMEWTIAALRAHA
ncbi:MerR family transcriptional regulator [Streptomyces somaliensis DSM 40738]|uniref:MerR family transcriptional regulator n=1 Tax=Streptomyces somaliensis (strain ATCC 33201 / DSM 40738 / JCM 12659 / KCTC 9044 / NCTC 11332 / NRRL B-12077 / IP 733) TaxID=1134445 RepID=A0AA44DE03_STRE0|nr:MerR family transcriptional regulator [Streptomyces somaliensis]MCQ0022537.1 MerR family transcriptional regulator [Streptomyces somaliensis DSM 40738]NKY14718.1 MerR family transcriptional regulator [Streptomyces somaliensis DSM 40738]